MKILSIFFTLFFISNVTCAAESLEALSKRIRLEDMSTALREADPRGFSSLPAKGYKKGLTGILIKYNVYPNPECSFTDCDTDIVITNGSKKAGPGCIVSIKLAKKLKNGKLRDIGIRVEYGIAPGGKQFVANNSAYAQHAINGNGMLEHSLKD